MTGSNNEPSCRGASTPKRPLPPPPLLDASVAEQFVPVNWATGQDFLRSGLLDFRVCFDLVADVVRPERREAVCRSFEWIGKSLICSVAGRAAWVGEMESQESGIGHIDFAIAVQIVGQSG